MQQLCKSLTLFRLHKGNPAGNIKQMCAWERNGLQQLNLLKENEVAGAKELKKLLILYQDT